MTEEIKKSVVYIRIGPQFFKEDDPFLINSGITRDDITRGSQYVIQVLREEGFEADLCFVDQGDTAVEVVADLLKEKAYDVVVIGSGIRTIPGNLILFEKLINVVHEKAPNAKIALNGHLTDTLDAVLRVLNDYGNKL